jgi:hypothetical protein
MGFIEKSSKTIRQKPPLLEKILPRKDNEWSPLSRRGVRLPVEEDLGGVGVL